MIGEHDLYGIINLFFFTHFHIPLGGAVAL